MDPGAQTAVGRARAHRRGTSPWQRVIEMARHDLGPALVGSVLPFALVLYLALRGGGYDRLVYSEVGIAVWWVLLLAALVGVLPAARISRAGWVALALLFGFVVWTALGITWSESAERSAAEAGRLAAYLGVFALALAAQDRDGMRRTINAVAAAIVLVGLLALLSRLHPAWFPRDDAAQRLPEVGNRLNYPLQYWNGLAALIAIGIPLVLTAALRARHLVTQALAAAALPAMALTAFYTFSRGGALAIGIGVLTLLGLHPRRVAMLPTLALSGAGAALLIAAATQRTALEDDVLSDAARTQGHEMLAIVLVVCAGVGLVQVAIGLAARHGLGPRPRVTPRRVAPVAAVAATVVVLVALLTGLPGELAERAESSTAVESGSGRFQDLGNADNRIRYWNSALDANASAPLTGIGPGTFEFWWARNGDLYSFARDAHSLVLETLAELGIIGLILIVSFIAVVLGAGVRRAGRSGLDVRTSLVAAIASCVAFVVAAAVDWIWELPAVPVAFLLLAAAILGPARTEHREGGEVGEGSERRAWLGARGALTALAILALAPIAVPYLSTWFVRESQSQLRAGELDSALSSAETASAVEPFAATASTQRALVLARSGELGRAAETAREATREEPTNYRTWLLLARLDAERGRAASAIAAYDTAYDQNPHSIAFVRESPASFASRLKE
jgi:hypothetical protein